MVSDRSGLKEMSLNTVSRVLRTHRADQRDVYQNLTRVHLDVADGLAELPVRFHLDLRSDECRGPLQFTETSMRQLCRIAGIPDYAVAKMPAAVGLVVLRCMLEVAGNSIDRLYLFRLRETPERRVVRAILPASYIRCDDEEVLQTVVATMGTKEARVSNLTVNGDLFALRILLPEGVDFGSAKVPDQAKLGVDIRSSETGCCPTEVRYLVHRLICSNGLTAMAVDGKKEMRRTGRLDPEGFRKQLVVALEQTLPHGRNVAQRLVQSRHDYLDDPIDEVARVFHIYRLGSPRGKVGRWITTELIKDNTLLHARRFDLVQAFTAVARSLEHAERLRIEDVMTDYLLSSVSMN